MHKSYSTILSRVFKRFEESLNYLLFLLNPTSGKPSVPSTVPNRILIARLDSIGDFVLFSHCLEAYRTLFPNAWLVLLVKDNVYNLAETCPYVDEVWSLPCRKFRLNVLERLRWYRIMSTARFDLAVNAAFSYAFAFLDCLIGWTGAPRRVAFQYDGSDRLYGRQRQYFTEFVYADEENRYEIDRNYEMLRYLGYSGLVAHKTEVWLTESDRRNVSALCQKLKGKPYAILFPGALIEERRWHAENFIMAIRKINGRYPLHWAICGSADEAELCGHISSRLSNSSIPNADLAGKTSIRELAVLTEDALFYLGNETSGAHIAAAVGTPAVCILGGGHPGRFFPYPANKLTIAVNHQLSCYNCDWQCTRLETECISEIKADDVVDEVVKLMKSIDSKKAESNGTRI